MTTSAETIGQGVVKSGWLHRQSDFLRRWKRNFCVILTNGRLFYYTNESKYESEGSLNLCNCYFIKVGHQVQNASPPPGLSRGSMFEVKTPENIITFCADSADDAEAWKTSMMEAKQANNPRPCPQQPNTGIYPAQYAGVPPPYIAAPPPYASTVTTTTTYRNGQRVVVQQQSVPAAHNVAYPVQASAYSYPGQTVYTTYGAPTGTTVIPGQNQHTTIYTQGQTRRNNIGDAALVGAAVGGMMMMPLLFW